MSGRTDATDTDTERKDPDKNEKLGTSGTCSGRTFPIPHDPGQALAGAVGVNPPYGVASLSMTAGRARDRNVRCHPYGWVEAGRTRLDDLRASGG